jgi:hypothetical protein
MYFAHGYLILFEKKNFTNLFILLTLRNIFNTGILNGAYK